MYYRHSGQPGGFKQENLATLRQRAPEQIIESAVKGMLPKNKLQQPRLLRLKIMSDDQHPYADKLKA
jgi:large subunit ribosomal protein L13